MFYQLFSLFTKFINYLIKNNSINFFVFHNELMTPAVNNGPNYFTFFTALILEETYRHNQFVFYTLIL